MDKCKFKKFLQSCQTYFFTSARVEKPFGCSFRGQPTPLPENGRSGYSEISGNGVGLKLSYINVLYNKSFFVILRPNQDKTPDLSIIVDHIFSIPQ